MGRNRARKPRVVEANTEKLAFWHFGTKGNQIAIEFARQASKELFLVPKAAILRNNKRNS